jgi:hypothetical protein
MTARLDDWDTLSVRWRAQLAEAPLAIDGLRRTVHRRHRELLALVSGEVALTAVVLGAVVRLLRGGFNRTSIMTTTLVLLVTVVVWAFTIWNRRGIWRPLSETTTEYLRLSRQRIAAGRRTVIFVRASASVYTVAYGTWFVSRVSRHSLDSDEQVIWLIAAAYCSLLVAWSVWYARRLTRELERIESMERSLGLCEAA